MNQVRHLLNEAMRYVDRLDTQEWALLLAAIMGVGAFCLRGFGSRSNY